MIPVVVVDDNAVIRSGVKSLLEAGGVARVVGEAANGEEALRLARERRPEVVLLDVRMPVAGGLEVCGELAGLARVLMLTYAEDDEIVAASIRAGASGYLVHGRFGPDELGEAVRTVAAGGNVVSPAVAATLFSAVKDRDSQPDAPAGVDPGVRAALTAREAEIMDLVAQGWSNQHIADRLFVGEKTVKNHINRAYGKLGAATRAEAMAAWLGTRRP